MKRFSGVATIALISALLLALSPGLRAADQPFQVDEASIDAIHRAIQSGATTCKGVVQAYLDRAKAYNGICTQLVTQDGTSIAAVKGRVRAGAALNFPSQTLAASSFLPRLDQYQGLPLDLGRMEATISDPGVQQQYGMITGLANAGQLNALETLNLRGERSVSCKAECDLHPSKGKLAASCPAACDALRKLPDALERAAELDAQYGRKPDLARLPMYCATISVKNWYDVKDIRSTGGNDVNYAVDVPPDDSTMVANLRDKGAIVYAVTIAAEVGYGGDEPKKPGRNMIGDSGQVRSSWAGQTCNPYDTTRTPGPSSGGAGVSVSANLVTCAVCETTGGSCREPANQNAVASFVTTKGLTSEDGSATAQHINHRPGALCRTLGDAARVIDAMRSPADGAFDSKDMFTAVPRALEASAPYARYVLDEARLKTQKKPLQGLRIAVVREYMVKHTPNDAAISDRVDAEIKQVLRDQLGAAIVESIDPLYPDDPAIPNMAYSFARAFGETIAFNAPEYFFQMSGQMNGKEPEFAVPGYDVRTRDYQVKLAMGQAPLSDKLNMRRIISGLDNTDRSAFSMAKYLAERGDARVFDWASYAANSKWRSEAEAVEAQNGAAANLQDIRATRGIDRIKMQTVFRMAILKAMRENRIDLFVHPNVGLPQWKIGIDREPAVAGRTAAGPSITDLLGAPEVIVPAGFDDTVYEPQYQLSEDRKSYKLVTGTQRSRMAKAMPFSINFWAGPGDEPVVLKAASAYEAATKHRRPPSAFGPLLPPAR